MISISRIELFHPFIFNLFLPYLKQFSCKKYIVGVCFNMLCQSLLLIGIFRNHIFSIITKILGHKSAI